MGKTSLSRDGRQGTTQHNVYCVAQRSVRRELSLLLCLRPNGKAQPLGGSGVSNVAGSATSQACSSQKAPRLANSAAAGVSWRESLGQQAIQIFEEGLKPVQSFW